MNFSLTKWTSSFVWTVFQKVHAFAEYSTIQGLGYIAFSKQTHFGKIFWIVAVLSMLSIGGLLSVQLYNDWQNNQVLTTIKTIAHSVKDIEFPSVTFCSQGNNEIITNATLIKKFYDFLQKKYNIGIPSSPMEIAEIVHLSVKNQKKYCHLLKFSEYSTRQIEKIQVLWVI